MFEDFRQYGANRNCPVILNIDINVLQCSLATWLRFGGIFNDHVMTNLGLLPNVSASELWKSPLLTHGFVRNLDA